MSFEDDPADDRYLLDQCVAEIKSLQSTIAAQAEAIRVLREACEAAMEFHNDCYSHLDQRRLPSRTKQRTALIRKALASTAKYEEPRE